MTGSGSATMVIICHEPEYNRSKQTFVTKHRANICQIGSAFFSTVSIKCFIPWPVRYSYSYCCFTLIALG